MSFSHELLELKEFGADANLSLDHHSVIAATRFVCMLYSKQDFVNINYLRHKLLTQKNLSGDKLPSTLGALSLRLQRANYQSHIWRFACIPILDLPSPESRLNWVNPYTETIHSFTLVKYAKNTWDECQLQASCLQLSE